MPKVTEILAKSKNGRKEKRSGMVSFGGVITLQLFDLANISVTSGTLYFGPVQVYSINVRIEKMKSYDPP